MLRDADKTQNQENEAMCELKWKIAFTTNYIIWTECMSYCIRHDKIVNIYMHVATHETEEERVRANASAPFNATA